MGPGTPRDAPRKGFQPWCKGLPNQQETSLNICGCITFLELQALGAASRSGRILRLQFDARTKSVWATGRYDSAAFVSLFVVRRWCRWDPCGEFCCGVQTKLCVPITLHPAQTYGDYTIVGNPNDSRAVFVIDAAKNGDPRFGASYQGEESNGRAIAVDDLGLVYLGGYFTGTLTMPPLADLIAPTGGQSAFIFTITGGAAVSGMNPLQVSAETASTTIDNGRRS